MIQELNKKLLLYHYNYVIHNFVDSAYLLNIIHTKIHPQHIF